MSKGVYRIVVSRRHVAQHGAPEVDIYLIALRRDCNLHLLNSGTIRRYIMLLCNSRDGPRKLNVSRLELPDVARQPNSETVIRYRHHDPRILKTGNPCDCFG
ncbi:hypothetical protein L1047_09075 [Synechococcus sp. Nb3U1]|uniref:hypothetical protein n=1 Tax=Synechococcus sp. Nb3U1 TaxID=1914529 RepID=UPI001F1BE2CE|nr:hypothetical protein [Synechococcus sp. Nb3U1]MCF2971343.1 hypothetical protein [Synechococcus sp. Nb3U1]